MGLVAAMTLAACGETSRTVGADPAWEEPSHYSYVLRSSCGERPLLGRFRITVENGQVTKAEGVSDADKRSLESTELRPPTLGQFLDELAEARRNGADQAELTTDPTDGHPTKFTIDPIERALDDEACYAITEYRAG
ncbi:hypothetical protein Psuf_046530 [Phytohabitans suffuscus]|uniref:Lipoprotein n=1 Tax=Phytohabitans suffuscus TaxID=624315 RepID=A0A6F8YMK8_9ACTN|nr:hypothetical protein Psuf_046530 [Phytohabitans suffuscus]